MFTFEKLYNLTKPYHLDKITTGLLPEGHRAHLVTYVSDLKPWREGTLPTRSMTEGVIVGIELGPSRGRKYTSTWGRKFKVLDSGLEDHFTWDGWGITFIIIP